MICTYYLHKRVLWSWWWWNSTIIIRWQESVELSAKLLFLQKQFT